MAKRSPTDQASKELCDLLHEVLRSAKARQLFMATLRRWPTVVENRIAKLRAFERRRRKHFMLTIQGIPRLMDKNAGPPGEGWRWETCSWRDEHGDRKQHQIAGWCRPRLHAEREPITGDLLRYYKSDPEPLHKGGPLPGSPGCGRLFNRVERYAIAAAVCALGPRERNLHHEIKAPLPSLNGLTADGWAIVADAVHYVVGQLERAAQRAKTKAKAKGPGPGRTAGHKLKGGKPTSLPPARDK